MILYASFAYFGFDGWDDQDRDPAELRARVLRELGEDYTPSTEQFARAQEIGPALRSAWGSGALLKAFMPSVRSIRQLAMMERMSASPGMARATLEAQFRIDVRPILPTITVPPWSSMPVTTRLRCRAAGISPTTSPARGGYRLRAWIMRPISPSPTRS